MISFFREFIFVSIVTGIAIVPFLFLRKYTQKSYSAKWSYYISLIFALRLILPIQVSFIELPILHTAIVSEGEKNVSKNVTDMVNIADVGGSDVHSETTDVLPNSNTNTFEERITDNNSLSSSRESDTSVQKRNNIHNSNKEEFPKFIMNKIVSSHHPSLNPTNVTSLLLVLCFLWLTVFISLLVRDILAHNSYYTKIKRFGTSVTDKQWLSTFLKLKEELHINRDIPFLTCSLIETPMAIGILSPTIILPAKEFSLEQVEVILRHELIHVKSKHLPCQLLLLLAKRMHWFNPCAYVLFRCAKQDMEYLCDASVVKDKPVSYKQLYSITILETLTGKMTFDKMAVSTYFNSGKDDIKHRFQTIMQNSVSKNGVYLFAFFSICIMIISVTTITNTKQSEQKPSTESALSVVESTIEPTVVLSEDSKENLERKDAMHFLVVGLDNCPTPNNNFGWADGILLVSVFPETQKIKMTTILRDTAFTASDGKIIKASRLYSEYGPDAFKEIIGQSLNIAISGIITFDYRCFETFVDQIGGVSVVLSKDEANYLNHTNFISKPKNRNLKNGEQLLNGDQCLGYVRIRHVASIEGDQNEFGRAYRLRLVGRKLYEKLNCANVDYVYDILNTIAKYVSTDIEYDTAKDIISALYNKYYLVQTFQLPEMDEYEPLYLTNANAMSVEFEKARAYRELHIDK